jgi:hypothetical protein
MKSFLAPTYTFTPGASGVGTVDLSGISGFNIKFLVAVINQTRGVTIYATGSTATRYTALAGTTLTLFADTSDHNSGDVLQVIYDELNPLTADQLAAVELTESVRQMQGELEILRNTIGQTRVDGGGRLRVLLDQISGSLTLGTVSTLSTLTTLTNQTSIGGIAANDQVPALRRLAADTLLTKISLT